MRLFRLEKSFWHHRTVPASLFPPHPHISLFFLERCATNLGLNEKPSLNGSFLNNSICSRKWDISLWKSESTLSHSTLKPNKVLEVPACHRRIHSNCYKPRGSSIIFLPSANNSIWGDELNLQEKLWTKCEVISFFKCLRFRRLLIPECPNHTSHEANLPFSQQ